jgi:hypothetical protein
MKKIIILITTLMLLGGVNNTFACTTFIISGKYTRDGRPVLYKHRDTGTLDNALAYFSDGRFDYIGLVDSDNGWKKNIWGGYNSAGFAIMNSAAYNNNIGDTTKFSDQEGVIMKLALQKCATLADFEKLLSGLPKPLGVDANFGVIDASGGAAYYETGNSGFKKIDANDPAVAPYGYIVRTNHSFTGVIDKGFGYVRYETAYEALYQAAAMNKLEPQYLFNNISRNLYHSLTKENLRDRLPHDNKTPDFRYFEDFIPRNSSAAVIMVVGVKKGEDPSATMMWSLLGFPLTAVATPVWISGGKQLPAVVSMKSDLHSPLCDAAMQLKNRCFPIRRGEGPKYINLSVLLNQEGNGFMQILSPAENEIFAKTKSLLETLPAGKEKGDRIREYYRWLDEYVSSVYMKNFGVGVL